MAPRLPVLVTGGAGYIGSHVVRVLRAAGYPVVAYDDLSTGFPWAVLERAELIVGGRAERARLALFAERRFGAVLHFAASVRIDKSRRDPAKCYRNNVAHALGLFESAARSGVSRLVFSSTAAVCDEPETLPIDEAAPLAPISPYGASKIMSERGLAGVAAASGLRCAVPRYFNAAGADLGRRIGKATGAASHLIKASCETAVGMRPGLRIHGRTTRPPTAPACSTPSMWPTSRGRISMLSNTSRAARARSCSTGVVAAATPCGR